MTTSANATLQRRLSLLRRMLLSPAPRDILTGHVHQELLDAYPHDNPEKTQNDFNNDVKALRAWGVDIRTEGGDYHVESYGDFAPVALPEAELQTLAFLLETFGPDTPRSRILFSPSRLPLSCDIFPDIDIRTCGVYISIVRSTPRYP